MNTEPVATLAAQEFNWNDAGGYEKVRYAATEALRALGATDKTKARKYHEVYARAEELFPELTTGTTAVAENSFNSYLSQTVKDENSLINCEGPWKGYYLLPPELAPNQTNASAEPSAPQEDK